MRWIDKKVMMPKQWYKELEEGYLGLRKVEEVATIVKDSATSSCASNADVMIMRYIWAILPQGYKYGTWFPKLIVPP